jgi:hypothetical protein
MSLEDKLAATRAAGAGRIPADRQAIMHRATEDLRKSGILDRIVPVGRWSFRSSEDRGDPTAGMSWRLCKAFTPTSRASVPRLS